MLFEVQLLAANVWEWIGPLIVVGFYILSYLFRAANSRNAQTPPARSPFSPPSPPMQSGGGRGQSRGAKQPELNSEIEQFLKRASERRGEKQQREKPQRQFPQSPSSDRPRSQNEPPKPPREKREQRDKRPEFGSVAASVEQHLGSRNFDQREKKLAEDVVRAEAQLEQHVQQTFSGRLGNLSSDTDTTGPLTDVQTEAIDDRTQVAKELAASLANPQSIKQAIMLHEILMRPIDRW